MTGFIERVLSVQTLNNKRGCTQRVIVVNDVAQQFDDMPTPSADTLGLIVQYTGETTADFTHGYFYEGSSSTTSSSATATQTVGSGLTDIAVDVETLEAFTGWTTDNSLQIFYTDDGWSVDTTSLGVTYTGTPSVGDAITISYTAGVTTYGWQQVDVQPSGGGGDSHNLGWYATQAALEEAYPTAEAGDWAIVGATDTVWIWDTDNSAWVDSDQKGQVTSVNGQTGAVVLSIPDAVQYSTMPTAASTNEGDIVQFIGTTDANYTNGYFYKCVSDGQNPATYSWTQVNVQPAPSGLPDQTGQSGKFLTTDGTDASWSDKPLVNKATGTNAIGIGAVHTVSGQNSIGIGSNTKATLSNTIAIGTGTHASGTSAVLVGGGLVGAENSVGLGKNIYIKNTGVSGIAIGCDAGVTASNAIQISSRTYAGGPNVTNSDANTFKVANNNGNFEIMSADGTVPADRLVHAINKYSTMPTAASTNEGWIVQFTGTTDATYTHGHLYECVSDGGNPATYSWTEIQLGGGSSLPSQTGNAGKFLTTDGTDASWSDKPLANQGTGAGSVLIKTTSTILGGYYSIGIGCGTVTSYAVGIGLGAIAEQMYTVAIGVDAKSRATGAIQFGDGQNTTANTLQFRSYQIIDANGNLPADRLASTTGLADGNYRLRLTMSNGTPTLSWVAE